MRRERTLNQGVVLATPSGQTLYRHDGYISQSGGGHSLRRGQQARPAVGRQGYALWTYDGDKRPGDVNGNDALDYGFANQPEVKSADTLRTAYDPGTPMDGLPALYWAIAAP